MADDAFVSADIGKLESFERRSKDAITEFNAIKDKFNEINSDLLKKWKGVGADTYAKEVNHILEKIGDIKDILDALNNGAIKDTKDNYLKLDDELGEFNKNPESSKGE